MSWLGAVIRFEGGRGPPEVLYVRELGCWQVAPGDAIANRPRVGARASCLPSRACQAHQPSTTSEPSCARSGCARRKPSQEMERKSDSLRRPAQNRPLRSVSAVSPSKPPVSAGRRSWRCWSSPARPARLPSSDQRRSVQREVQRLGIGASSQIGGDAPRARSIAPFSSDTTASASMTS
jgi:hypothetical protein